MAGPCYQCGQIGHLRNACPRLNGGTGNKTWYPPLSDTPDTVFDECCIDELSLGCVHSEAVQPGTSLPSCTDECVEGMDECDMLRYFTEVLSIPETPNPGVCVKGRLKEHASYWEKVLEAPQSVLSIVRCGYVLPLKSMPPPLTQKNQLSANTHADFVHDSVRDLQASGCIRKVDSLPHVCSPLSVVLNSAGKKRLVINLRYVNSYLYKRHFKYEDLHTAMLLFEQGDFMFSFDLKSGYHHVDVAEVHHTLLGFEWEKTYYVFTVLLFGLSTACYVFTKLLRPLVRYWRSQGIRITLYLDDGLAVAASKDEARQASALVQSTLEQAGFITHPEKSQWTPAQQLTWLGFVIDMEAGKIEVPQEKISALRELTQKFQLEEIVTARLIASVVSRIIAMSLAVGPISRFMTRSLYALINSRLSWYGKLQLTDKARFELNFWDKCIGEYKSQPIWRSPSALRVVYSDASDTGYGGYTVEHGPCIAHGQWTVAEANQSSTWRELTAVLRVLSSIACKLHNTRVRWFTDNQNVVHIIQVGSRKEQLQALALEIFQLAVQHNIHLEPEWIPRELNQQADYLSRIIDYDDWRLNPKVFAVLDSLWGPHTVDRFADSTNTQLQRFNSRYWSPGTEAVDAFTVNWAGENNWLCPPVSLIPRVLRHAQNCNANCTIVMPAWPSAPFWPLLCPTQSTFAAFVVEICELPMTDDLFLPGCSGAVVFGGKVPNTPVYAVRCEF